MSLKALIFDNDALTLQLTEQYLKHKNIEASARVQPTCPMFELALTSCSIDDPPCSLIIMGNHSQSKSGIDFLEEIQQKGCKIPHHRKVLITGDPTPDVQLRAKKLGVQVLQKPYPLEKFYHWLDQAVGSR